LVVMVVMVGVVGVAGVVGFAGPLRVTPTPTPTITPTTTNVPMITVAIPFVLRYHGIDFYLVTSFE